VVQVNPEPKPQTLSPSPEKGQTQNQLLNIRDAIELLRSGILRKVLDDESLGAATYYMVTAEVGAMERENGLPGCVDKYLEWLLRMVEQKMQHGGEP